MGSGWRAAVRSLPLTIWSHVDMRGPVDQTTPEEGFCGVYEHVASF